MNLKFWNKKIDGEKDRNKKLTSNTMGIIIKRLVNGTAVSIARFSAVLTRDNNNNTILLSDENKFKEELPDMVDSLVSDVLFKFENRGLSTKEQSRKVDELIKVQDDLLLSTKGGYVVDEKGVRVKKINIKTEKNKLNLFKCVKYTLENKKGEGYYEEIEIDGTRSLTYLVRDGNLIPYWHRTPDSEGEPVILVPDVVQRKKFYKEASDETINDFNESQNTMWRGVLGTITQVLLVIFLLANIGWTVHNARWSGDLVDESLEPQIEQLKVDNERIRQLCSSQIANQIANNGVLIDYATSVLNDEISSGGVGNNDKSNINI